MYLYIYIMLLYLFEMFTLLETLVTYLYVCLNSLNEVEFVGKEFCRLLDHGIDFLFYPLISLVVFRTLPHQICAAQRM